MWRECYRLQKQLLLHSSLILVETKNERGAPARNYRLAINKVWILDNELAKLNTLGQWLDTRE
jgi:hypothetical protein